ncbi:hypothetical protein GCM10011369_02450 [Neiella marina]|uniref:Response regulatory domain-containing protein n=1 Tax=Neiella marina TaxID=508461 RepID=A0A8J2XN03_9GAMM|nr:DUF3369 domain-containing protein [Neiella marina]GGA64584.1 hypothetical protein GCM10011369_02450 [Neiella marina]
MDWLLDDKPECAQKTRQKPWKIAIVDDEPQVHKITKLALQGFEFENRSLTFVQAYDAASARELFRQHNDIAVVLLDVVMDSDDAGLRLVEFLRDDLGNHYSRIVLRTGQPGMAPQHEVVSHYDIDCYRAKTELTHQALTQTFYTTLRAYRDLVRMQRYQHGLEAVIKAISQFNEVDDFSQFAQSLMGQVGSVLNAYQSDFMVHPSEIVTLARNSQQSCWHLKVDDGTANNVSIETYAHQAMTERQSIFQPPVHAHYYRSAKGTESVFVIQTTEQLSAEGERLLAMFSQNIVLILERIMCSQESASSSC